MTDGRGSASGARRYRILLSPPHLTGTEEDRLRRALASNWIAPVGPEIDAFERQLARLTGVAGAAAVASGTAALHLALRLVGVGPGDRVLCSTLTFVASANAIRYLGAEPVFIDCDRETWNLDPALLEAELAEASGRGAVPRALVVTDLYGQAADYDRIHAACEPRGVAVVEDAAEALGASYRGRPAGGLGRVGILSFNGNKIVTTSGGGALVSDDLELVGRARFLATQARDPAPHYEHSEIGYNYRLSNLLAAVGRAQLDALEERVRARRAVFAAYAERLGDLPGVAFMPEADYGRSTRWLSCLTIDPEAFGASRDAIIETLSERGIEARPVWKPLHLQPLYAASRVRGGEVAEALFRDGLCLPSGSALTADEIDEICGLVRAAAGPG